MDILKIINKNVSNYFNFHEKLLYGVTHFVGSVVNVVYIVHSVISTALLLRVTHVTAHVTVRMVTFSLHCPIIPVIGPSVHAAVRGGVLPVRGGVLHVLRSITGILVAPSGRYRDGVELVSAP